MEHDTYDALTKYRILYIGDLPDCGYTISYPKSDAEYHRGPKEKNLKKYHVTSVSDAIDFLQEAIFDEKWDEVVPERFGLIPIEDEDTRMSDETTFQNELYLQELRQCCEKLEMLYAQESLAQQSERLLNDVLEMVRYSRIVRNEGWYYLNKARQNCKHDLTTKEELKSLMSITCGNYTLTERVSLLLSRLVSTRRGPVEKFAFLIYLTGVFSILSEDAPAMTEQRLRSILPEWLEEKFNVRIEEERERRKRVIEQSFEDCTYWRPDDKGYFIGLLLDKVYTELSDEDIELLNDEVEEASLISAFRGMCGKAKKKMMTNLPDEKAERIFAKALCNMPDLTTWIACEDGKILGKLAELIGQGKIAVPESCIKLFQFEPPADEEAITDKAFAEMSAVLTVMKTRVEDLYEQTLGEE